MVWQLIAHKTYNLEPIVHGAQPVIYNLQLITQTPWSRFQNCGLELITYGPEYRIWCLEWLMASGDNSSWLRTYGLVPVADDLS